MLMRKQLRNWQVTGFIFTSVMGVILHFAYDWLGGSVLLAPFSAVNESIFEHMKLLFFPLFAFAVFENRFIGKTYKNFWCAKFKGALLGLTLIPVLYYSYTGIFGVNADWFNITIFFISAAVSLVFETALLNKNKPCIISSKTAFILLCAISILFVFLTFFPLHIPLFKDPMTGLYGRV